MKNTDGEGQLPTPHGPFCPRSTETHFLCIICTMSSADSYLPTIILTSIISFAVPFILIPKINSLHLIFKILFIIATTFIFAIIMAFLNPFIIYGVLDFPDDGWASLGTAYLSFLTASMTYLLSSILVLMKTKT